MSDKHFETVRDAKKIMADLEYLIVVTSCANTVGEVEAMLKNLGAKAQAKRQNLMIQQKELKKK